MWTHIRRGERESWCKEGRAGREVVGIRRGKDVKRY